MNSPMELSGKTILITGASSGLGRQTCITASLLGAKVIMLARNEERLKKTLERLDGNGHSYYCFDVNSVEDISALIEEIVKENGKLDGFVHCAGIGDLRPLASTTYEFMQEMMRIHVFSFVEFVRIISKKKYSNDGASIVAISSVSSTCSEKGKTAYTTAKGALDSTILPMAIELGEKRSIRVNTVNPGWIKTDMYYDYINTVGQEKMDESLKDYILGAAEPEEVANVIAFLLSSSASKITGQSIYIDGGASL